MIRFTTLILAAALGGTVLGGAAYAAQDATPAAPQAGTHHHRGHGDRLARLDANHDGVITRAEAIAAADARFARMDTNGDGTVTQQEMQARRDAMRAKWQQRRAERGDQAAKAAPDGTTGKSGWKGHHRRHGMMLKRLDVNHDGAVTKAEAEAAAARHFDRIDSNHDGRLDQAEIAALKAKMQAHRQEMRAKWQARHAAQPQPQPSTDR